jgi:hypothetical protein
MYIDLIRRRLNNKYYRHIEALEFDIDLIYKNCAFFNAEGTSIVADANELVIQMKRIIFDGIYVEGIIYVVVFNLLISIIIITGTAENPNHLTSQSSSSSSSLMHEPTDESRNAKKRQTDDDHYGEVENDAKPKRSRNIRFTYDDSESKATIQDESSNLRLTLRRNATSSQDEISGRRSSRSSSEKRKSYSEIYSDEDDFDDKENDDDDDDNNGNDRYARNTRTSSSRTTAVTGGISLRKRHNVNYNEDEAFEHMNGHSARNTRTRNTSRRYNYDDDDDDEEEDDHGDDNDERDEYARPVRSSRRVIENKENNDHTNAHVNSSRSSRTVAAASSR